MYTRDLEGAEVSGMLKDDKVPQDRQVRRPAGDCRVSQTEQGGAKTHRVVPTKKEKKGYILFIKFALS